MVGTMTSPKEAPCLPSNDEHCFYITWYKLTHYIYKSKFTIEVHPSFRGVPMNLYITILLSVREYNYEFAAVAYLMCVFPSGAT